MEITLKGYKTEITKNADGSVSFAVHVGFPVGTETFSIPAADWAQIVAYTEGSVAS